MLDLSLFSILSLLLPGLSPVKVLCLTLTGELAGVGEGRSGLVPLLIRESTQERRWWAVVRRSVPLSRRYSGALGQLEVCVQHEQRLERRGWFSMGTE